METRALRVRAKVDTYAAQEVIAWREIIGDPEVMRAMVRHPNRHVAKRARLAVWKRERLAAKAPPRTDPPAAWNGDIPHEPNEDK
jgi:hypothetical protein